MGKKETMLFIGLAFGLAAGFVLGWLWGDRPNYLSDVRVLDVLVAIGTIGAVFSGFALNYYNQTKKSRRSVKGLLLGVKGLRGNIGKIVAKVSHTGANQSSEVAELCLHKSQTMNCGNIRQVFFSPSFNLGEYRAVVRFIKSIDCADIPYRAALYLESVILHYEELLNKIDWQLKWCTGHLGNPYNPFEVAVIDELTRLEENLQRMLIS